MCSIKLLAIVTMKKNAVNIYTYLSYRQYLNDKLELEKLKKDFTLRKFARLAGFGSHTFISQLIKGTRSATIETAPSFA